MTPGRLETVADLVLARSADDTVGLRFEHASYTWRDIVERCCARAAWLRTHLDPGWPRHAGVLLENEPEFLFLLGGAALDGAVVVGVNPTRRGAELARDIRHTDCQLLVTDTRHRADLLDGLDLPGVQIVTIDDEEFSAAAAPEPEVLPEPGDLYLLLFTSGSTGAPKAVRMSQGRAARTSANTLFTADDVLYCAMPLFHGNALHASVFPALRTGATLVLRRRFSASEFLDDLRRFGATFFNTVGRALGYVLATPPTDHDRDHRVRYALGPEASPADIRAFRRRFGIPVIEGYGSSENAIIMAPVAGMPRGALGRPLEGLDVIVADPATGRECPRAEFDPGGRLLNAPEAIGELASRNALARFEGYYKNAEAEAERTRGGWYWSGDLAYRDADGWFYFAGRAGDWLRVDGENFAAAPVERILARFEPAAAVAVYGVPDAVTGDQVMAAIELRDPNAPFDPGPFAAFLAAQPDLGTKWAPRFVRIVERIPTTASNKIDKQPLRTVRWRTSDPVWWRPPRAAGYLPFTATDADALEREFEANERAQLLG
jgi:fatty-acyl-CoA synthase